MALSAFEQKRFERVVGAFVEERRPPVHLRSKVDLSFRVTGQSIEIFELRPKWDQPGRKIEHAIAKATYVKTDGRWRIFWQRADLKWHRYKPVPEVVSLEQFLEVVREDEHSCFFGQQCHIGEESRTHVHVHATSGEAKSWLEPKIEIAQNHGLSMRQVNAALRLIREREDEIRKAWKTHFGR